MDKESLIEHLQYCTNDVEIGVRVNQHVYPITNIQHQTINNKRVLVLLLECRPLTKDQYKVRG